MENSLINSSPGLDSKEFYEELFSKFQFLGYIALFLKEGRKYALKFETGIKPAPPYKTLKVPFKMNDESAGYFMFIKKSGFKKQEKGELTALCDKIASKIKDFEFSRIFKNQLEILQEAILEKNSIAKKLEEQNEKLLETDKIRFEFLANVSHELRTPLNSIIGFSTALKDGLLGELNAKQKDYAGKILSSAIHLSGLINDILDMTKIESGAMKISLKENCPNDIINEVINIIEPLALEKNIKIETKFNFEGKILLDYNKFKQIIYNLAGNAIKFSHADSKIVITTKKSKNDVLICIKDYGIGIDKKEHKRIFEKFVQLDNIYTKVYSSTGLGLTITQELLKLQNAKISLKSEPDKGSEFILKFSAI